MKRYRVNTLNTSLSPQNATWWNPITASESNQGSGLRSRLEQYIRFHTVENLGAYGLDEITEFNICCESIGGGSYAIHLHLLHFQSSFHTVFRVFFPDLSY